MRRSRKKESSFRMTLALYPAGKPSPLAMTLIRRVSQHCLPRQRWERQTCLVTYSYRPINSCAQDPVLFKVLPNILGFAATCVYQRYLTKPKISETDLERQRPNSVPARSHPSRVPYTVWRGSDLPVYHLLRFHHSGIPDMIWSCSNPPVYQRFPTALEFPRLAWNVSYPPEYQRSLRPV